jgi:beta-glucosidase
LNWNRRDEAIALGVLALASALASAPAPVAETTERDRGEARLAVPGPDDAADGARVAALVDGMTLDEKIGQMVMVDYGALASLDDIATYHLGALLPRGDEAPDDNTPQGWLDLTGSMQPKALATRLHIPLILGIDAVHGNAKVAGATVFPHDIGLGCARDPALVTAVERATAEEVRAEGFNMVFSPDADVGQDARWGRSYESFGEDPSLVSGMVAAAVTGYQTTTSGLPSGLLACPKHFVGAGGTSWGTGVAGGIDQGETRISEAQMRAVHLPPFKAAVDAGAMAIMVSYSSFAGTKMSTSTHWLTDVLKGELGFSGFLLSDFDAIRQLPGTRRQQDAAAINAGLDMIMMSNGYAAFIDDVKALVAEGTIRTARIDDAVTRILRAKVAAGLFDARAPDAPGLEVVGSRAHRRIAREAVQRSIVLLKNDRHVLPLPRSARVVVMGAGADDKGIESGGWTLGWQGVTGPESSSIAGTSLLAGMRAIASSPRQVTLSTDGRVPPGTSVGVVVIGERPYAESHGDSSDPQVADAGIMSAIASVHEPLVLVLVTGRPVRIESYLRRFAAVVVAWLPGSEGAGVADVLYGTAAFTAALTKSWPLDSTVLPISSLQPGAAALFAYGMGLRYGAAVPPIGRLP